MRGEDERRREEVHGGAPQADEGVDVGEEEGVEGGVGVGGRGRGHCGDGGNAMVVGLLAD